MYVCYTCGEEIITEKGEAVEFCSKCSGRILFKTTPKTIRTVNSD